MPRELHSHKVPPSRFGFNHYKALGYYPQKIAQGPESGAKPGESLSPDLPHPRSPGDYTPTSTAKPPAAQPPSSLTPAPPVEEELVGELGTIGTGEEAADEGPPRSSAEFGEEEDPVGWEIEEWSPEKEAREREKDRQAGRDEPEDWQRGEAESWAVEWVNDNLPDPKHYDKQEFIAFVSNSLMDAAARDHPEFDTDDIQAIRHFGSKWASEQWDIYHGEEIPEQTNESGLAGMPREAEELFNELIDLDALTKRYPRSDFVYKDHYTRAVMNWVAYEARHANVPPEMIEHLKRLAFIWAVDQWNKPYGGGE